METDISLPSITYSTPVEQAKQHQTSYQLEEYMETDIGLPPIRYKPPVVFRVQSLTYKQNNQLQTLSNLSPGVTDNKPRNTRPTYKRPIGIEQLG